MYICPACQDTGAVGRQGDTCPTCEVLKRKAAASVRSDSESLTPEHIHNPQARPKREDARRALGNPGSILDEDLPPNRLR